MPSVVRHPFERITRTGQESPSVDEIVRHACDAGKFSTLMYGRVKCEYVMTTKLDEF